MLSKSILRHRIRKALKKNISPREFVDFSNARSVGILFSAEDHDKFQAVKEFTTTLEDEGKKVSVLSFLGKNKENFEFRFNIFTKKDISFWGRYQSDEVLKFINEEFDYLYLVDDEPGLLMESILAESRAKCRVGKFLEEKKPFFELMIQPEGDSYPELIQQMHFYSKKINSP